MNRTKKAMAADHRDFVEFLTEAPRTLKQLSDHMKLARRTVELRIKNFEDTPTHKLIRPGTGYPVTYQIFEFVAE